MAIQCDYISFGELCHCDVAQIPVYAPADGVYTLTFKQNGRKIVKTQSRLAGEPFIIDAGWFNEQGCVDFTIKDANGVQIKAFDGCLWTDDFVTKWFDFWAGFHAGTNPPVPSPPYFANFCDDAITANSVFAGIEGIITDFIPYFVNTGDAACEFQTATFEELITVGDARDGAIFLQSRSLPTPRGWGYQLWCDGGVPHFEAYLSASPVISATPIVSGGFPPYTVPTGFIKVAEGIGATYNEYRDSLGTGYASNGNYRICITLCY